MLEVPLSRLWLCLQERRRAFRVRRVLVRWALGGRFACRGKVKRPLLTAVRTSIQYCTSRLESLGRLDPSAVDLGSRQANVTAFQTTKASLKHPDSLPVLDHEVEVTEQVDVTQHVAGARR